MSKAAQLKEAMEQAEANVQLMAKWSQRDLAERLHLVHIQLHLAEQKKDLAALELLEVWRSQLITARIYKDENKVPDELSEIQQAIADIEIMEEQTEQRQEAFSQPEPIVRKSISATKTTDTQLPLF
jgi:phosphoribosylanthranilate isomerase